MSAFRINDDQISRFYEDGYLRAPGMLDEEETRLLVDAARADSGMLDHAFGADDREGNPATTSTAWSAVPSASSTRWRSCWRTRSTTITAR